ncbi:hypothetical protein [Actinocatenispora rupis]|uniref:Uncharacterized protein n=1 Tax=Actinocatenispora rupis TaxID=519421 RepID=A0A8J3NBD4_9ACTN|nr:hypothetical protein [Actinocatenispora rupis]GID12951.1 hypothetical protein Aru02nite_38400 [Actinocatenispora rupis]
MIDLEAEIRRFVRVRYQSVFDHVHRTHARRPVPIVRQAILDELRRLGTTPRMELVDTAAEFISSGGRFELR